jgi:hypothetical protein
VKKEFHMLRFIAKKGMGEKIHAEVRGEIEALDTAVIAAALEFGLDVTAAADLARSVSEAVEDAILASTKDQS